MSYESPIQFRTLDPIFERIRLQLDETIIEATQRIDIKVDKDELIKALKYERNQYDKGYADGKRDALAEARPKAQWEHLGGDEWCCSACGNVIFTEGSWEHPLSKDRQLYFCNICGADMREEEEK